MGATPDKRLEQRAPTSFGSEGVGTDGGFAVPPDFREAITSLIAGEDSLLGRTDKFVSSGNSITVPVDDDAPWSTSGIQAFWEGENDQLTQSKPLIKQQTIRLNKLAVLVPVTDELLEDAPAIDAYLRRKVPEKMDFKLNLAIVQGNGVGMPLGILNSPATVSVAKFTSQDADTIVGVNIINMWSRMYAPSRATSVWLINQDIEPQLLTLMKVGKLDTGAVDTGWGVPLYLPANGLSGTPFSTLMGRPIIPTQACETIGDKGDIIFADLKQYMTAMKVGGVRAETSIHLWFDYDTTAFRFILRIAGQPWWGTAVSPRDGSNTLSPFVTLAAR
jgi:HK97 family phage major capsid protein